MLMKVVVENGVKKLVPLTADAGSGNPCGTVITTLSNTVPSGYLPLGAQFDTTQFPVLYAILGSDTIPTASALGLPTLSAGRYVIKATSGINENQADNVLSALTPVDVVALNNLHSVTSNAVANLFKKHTYAVPSDGTTLNPYGYFEQNVSLQIDEGYTLVSCFIHRYDTTDAVLFNLHYLRDVSWKVTIFNCANVQQTLPSFEITILLMKN